MIRATGFPSPKSSKRKRYRGGCNMMEATGHPISHRKPHEHGMEEEEKYILGFWIFLASDLVLFASLFATYLVLRTHTDGGPTEAHLFEIPVFTLETFLLLTSSFTCGL